MYIYPDNLKSKAVLWLWELRDIAIIGVGALISVFAMAQLGFLPPVVITAAYAFLSIRLEDTSILDFLRYAIRYFLLGQQTYDVSFHPISPDEIQEWYFTPLTWIQQGQEEKVLALAAQHGIEDFYAEKYLDTLRVGAETEPDELFDKSHGFYIAVVQGFFQDYYYTRGSSFSFLMEEKPEYARYFTPWAQVVPTALPNPAKNQIIENYCSGVYLSPNQVLQILRDLEQEPKVLEDLEKHWSDGQFAVLKKALTAAAELGTGLLEATEVVEPNPLHPNESTCYSNLFHCDRDGVYLYIDMAMKQIAQAMEQNKSDP